MPTTLSWLLLVNVVHSCKYLKSFNLRQKNENNRSNVKCITMKINTIIIYKHNKLVDDTSLLTWSARLVNRTDLMTEFFVLCSFCSSFFLFRCFLFYSCPVFFLFFLFSFLPLSPLAFHFIPLSFILYFYLSFFLSAFLPLFFYSAVLVYEQTRKWHKHFFIK
jgi:hypothetical protein